MNNLETNKENLLTEQQQGLFILWANVRCNVQCSCEEELRAKLGNKKVDYMKLDYLNHIVR